MKASELARIRHLTQALASVRRRTFCQILWHKLKPTDVCIKLNLALRLCYNIFSNYTRSCDMRPALMASWLSGSLSEVIFYLITFSFI